MSQNERKTKEALDELVPDHGAAWDLAVEVCARLIERTRCREWQPAESARQIRERIMQAAEWDGTVVEIVVEIMRERFNNDE